MPMKGYKVNKNTDTGRLPKGVGRHNRNRKPYDRSANADYIANNSNKLEDNLDESGQSKQNLHTDQNGGYKSKIRQKSNGREKFKPNEKPTNTHHTNNNASNASNGRRSSKRNVKAGAANEYSNRKADANQNDFVKSTAQSDRRGNQYDSVKKDHSDVAKPKRNRGFLEQKAERQKQKSHKNHVTHPYLRSGRHGNKTKVAVYGALDLGTNNCRLLLAKPQRRGFRVVDSFSRIIRLGEGLSKSNYLSDEAMDRTIDALKICSEKMAYRGVHRSRLIATEACRRSKNGAEFIHRVHAETGLKLEIIEQKTEAKLAVAGCAALLDERSNYALVFDIGGGSSELVLVEISPNTSSNGEHDTKSSPFHPDYRIIDWTSLPVGVVTLSERFGGRDVTQDIMKNMIEYVEELLVPFEKKHQISTKISNEKIHLLGTSGTVTTVAGIHLKLAQYDRRRIDGYWLESKLSLGVTDKLINMGFEGRANHPCIGAERADLVLAGCAIFNAIYNKWPAERTRVADRGLREGILTNLMSKDLALNGNDYRNI